MKLTEICESFDYYLTITPGEYSWGGKELCIAVLPNKPMMPGFVFAVIQNPQNGKTEIEAPISATFADSFGQPSMMDFGSYEKWLTAMTTAKDVMQKLNDIDWASEFESIWNAETCEVTA